MDNTPNTEGSGQSASSYWQMIDRLAAEHAAHTETAPEVSTPKRRKRLLPVAMAATALASGGAGFGIAELISGTPAATTVSHISTNPINSGSGYAGLGLGNGQPSTGNGFPGIGIGVGNSGTGQSSASNAAGGPSNAATIAKQVEAGLVDINTNLSYQDEEAAGTGMVLTSNGEILTNNHVIEGATSISVTDIGNGKTYQATVVGYDVTQDVAVLQLVGATGLTTVKTANSAAVKTGDPVVGIGNAGGVGGTPSYAGGDITGVNQSITASDSGASTSEHLTGLLATDAGIEPGDSGGPLVNTSGAVIGMDTAGSSSDGGFGFSPSTSSETEGFAIPINTALKVAKKIEAGTTTSLIHIGATAFLGVQVEPASTASSGTFGGYFGGGFGNLGNTGSSTTPSVGQVIENAISGEPAANAGLVAGDTITSVDGTTVTNSSTSLQQILLGEKPGATIPVTYVDADGTSHTVSVTLAAGPPQ